MAERSQLKKFVSLIQRGDARCVKAVESLRARRVPEDKSLEEFISYFLRLNPDERPSNEMLCLALMLLYGDSIALRLVEELRQKPHDKRFADYAVERLETEIDAKSAQYFVVAAATWKHTRQLTAA